MGSLSILLVLVLAQYVCSVPILKKNCEVGSGECSKEIMQIFFKDYSTGSDDPKLTVLDPATIPSIDYVNDEVGFTSKFRNVKVTGFKDVAVTDVIRDNDKHQLQFTLKFKFAADSDLTIAMKSGKTFSGTAKYEGDLAGAIKYTFTMTTKDGVADFVVGPETLTCHAENIKSTLSPELGKHLREDAEAQASKPDYKVFQKHLEKEACAMGKVVFQEAMQNFRYAATLGI